MDHASLPIIGNEKGYRSMLMRFSFFFKAFFYILFKDKYNIIKNTIPKNEPTHMLKKHLLIYFVGVPIMFLLVTYTINT